MNRWSRSASRTRVAASLVLLATATVLAPCRAGARPPGTTARRAAESRRETRPQTRPRGLRVSVDPARILVDDGDTLLIRWPDGDAETVRLLGVDAPETRHPEHDVPYAQPFGPEARAFAQGAFAVATRVELLRAATLDSYGRSLGYVFVNGRNYSVLLLNARLAAETVSHYGDNGLAAEAAEVLAAAKPAGPLPFEPPHIYRARMRDVSRWLGTRGMDAER